MPPSAARVLLGSLRLPRAALYFAALFAFALSACSSPDDELPETLRARLVAYVSETPFAFENEVGKCFAGGALCLMGYRAERQGGRIELELIHHVVKRPSYRPSLPLTRIFVSAQRATPQEHLDETRKSDETHLDLSRQGLVRELYPPSRWEPGQWIRERLSIPAPRIGRQSASMRLQFGHRRRTRSPFTRFLESDRPLTIPLQVRDRNPRGKDHRLGEDRAVEEEAIPSIARTDFPPHLVAKRILSPPTIDGELDEAAWVDAPIFESFRHPLTGLETRASGRLRMLYDDEALYLGVEIDDLDLHSEYDERDDPLWEADVFEFFLRPMRGKSDYFEIQTSPRGVIFDSHFERYRHPSPYGNVDFDSALELSVKAMGTFADEKLDTGYRIEARLPFQPIKDRLPAFRTPEPGADVFVNFFIVDRGKDYRSAAAASPPFVPDYHHQAAFARLTFLD